MASVETKICEFCQKMFSRPLARSTSQWEKQRFCGRGCSDDASRGPTVCSVSGCGHKVMARGWCATHYDRWQRGVPLEAEFKHARFGQAKKYLFENVLTYEGDECLIWPFYGDYYARITIDGTPQLLTRYICTRLYGAPPTPKHQAAHLCGKGHLGCCAPKHLRWATPANNIADKQKHGTAPKGELNPSAKLTEEDVRRILSLKGKLKPKVIAQQFNVSRDNIEAIHRGKSWRHLSEIQDV